MYLYGDSFRFCSAHPPAVKGKAKKKAAVVQQYSTAQTLTKEGQQMEPTNGYVCPVFPCCLPGLVEFVRSFSSGTRRRGLVEDVLKVLVWSFFAERLVQSALVGWGHSGRVGPVEQACFFCLVCMYDFVYVCM